MPRYMLTVAYDGTDYCGWQKQEPRATDADPTRIESRTDDKVILRTVQHTLEQAVREVVREPVSLLGASRTDAGVHAGGSFPDGARGGQVAAFTCSQEAPEGRGWPIERGTEPLVRAINSRLPGDVLVLGAESVPDAFDPIGDCVSKGYSYSIVCSPTRPLWDRRYVAHLWHPLDMERMQDAAAHIVGMHDFESFAAAGHGRQTTVRTIHACTVTETPGETQRLRIEVSGDGFLYNMVRIIAGTLVECGRAKIEPGAIPEIIEARDRRRAGQTMPPEGLRLEWIRYA